jgi:hypothetical protein
MLVTNRLENRYSPSEVRYHAWPWLMKKKIYYNIPFYEYPPPGTGGQKECTAVRLQTAAPWLATGTIVPPGLKAKRTAEPIA